MPKAPTNPTMDTTQSTGTQGWSAWSSVKVSSAPDSAMAATEPRSSTRRPAWSINSTDTMVTRTLQPFIAMAMAVAVSSDMPFFSRKEVEKLKALLIPEACCNTITAVVINIALRTAGDDETLRQSDVAGLTEPERTSSRPGRLERDEAKEDMEFDREKEADRVDCCRSSARLAAANMQKSSSCTSRSSGERSRSCTSISSAMRSLPMIAYHRGLSSSMGWSSSCSRAGAEGEASIQGQPLMVPSMEGKPNSCAANMPMTIMSWLSVPSMPRKCAGDTSPRYRGTTTVAPPHAMPETSRPPMRTATRLGHTFHPPTIWHSGRQDEASSIAPTKKMTEFHSKKVLRPHRSASCEEELQPRRAPSIKMEMMKDQIMSLEGRGTTTPSGVRADVGMPSAARIGLAGVFMLALL
mmetsp:Transcript_33668/g.108747  ORF Transcript_33668/g.108747 Transcript_33668/m.108747 type:complete len:410 (-) Transcript_33668:438-1667(-)